jgi:hypothetical protein
VNAPQTTNINLEYTFSTPGSNSNQQQVIYRPETTASPQRISPPTTPKVIYIQQTTTQTPQRPQVFIQETTTQSQRPQPTQTQSFDCGVPNFKTPFSSGLIVNGKNAIRGQFPW